MSVQNTDIMFSMAALASTALLTAESLVARAMRQNTALPSGWAELDAALPDGGLPMGVTELTAPRALGGATLVALAVMRAAHARKPDAWCAWVDPERTLFAPGVARAGVDLKRLLVVRPERV